MLELRYSSVGNRDVLRFEGDGNTMIDPMPSFALCMWYRDGHTGKMLIYLK